MKRLKRLAEKLELDQRVTWLEALHPDELRPWLAHAMASVAPLRDCDRNAIQGCSPLKILESMAAGLPVIASDLPPVRELITDGVNGVLIQPDRPAALARSIRVLSAYPDRRAALGTAARDTIATAHGWDQAIDHLREIYRELVSNPAPLEAPHANAVTEGPC
jgi:glycosyltransferase involved in cell wall biosynthesis